jgi:hypothetical protein
MRKSILSKLASTLLVLVSLMLSLWLVEIGLRLAFHGTVFSPIGDSSAQVRHPVRSTANKPNSQMGMLKLAFAATASINSRGVRGPEFEQAPKPGVYRILVVSDSGAFGSGVNDGEPMPDQMQAILGSDKFEVINLSVAAYTTVQQYLWLIDEGLSYKPNMVIFGFSPGNDIQTNYYPLQILFQNNAKRPYAVADGQGGFMIDNTHMEASLEKAKKTNVLHMVRDFVAGPLVKRVVEQAIEATGSGGKSDPNIWIGWPFLSEFSTDSAGANLTVAEYDKLWSEGWSVTKAVIRGMRDKTEAAGAKFVMYSYVNKMQGNPDYLAQVKAALPDLKLDMEKPEREFRAFGAEAGIPVISMYNAITREAGAGARDLYFGLDDEHMTARGHRVAAEALVADLKAQGLLPTDP